MSKATQTFDIQIKVVDVNDVEHKLNSSIAAELVATPSAREQITSYLIEQSKSVIIKKIGGSA